MNILFTVDEKDIRQLINLHLSKEGYRIFEAKNGIEAINIKENFIVNVSDGTEFSYEGQLLKILDDYIVSRDDGRLRLAAVLEEE